MGASDEIAETYHRLEISRWNGGLIDDYEKEKLDLSNYSMAFEEERVRIAVAMYEKMWIVK